MQQLSPAAKQKQVHAVQQLNNNTQLHQLDKHSMQAVAWWQVAAAAVVQWLRAVLHSHSGQHNTQLNERYTSSCACSTTQAPLMAMHYCCRTETAVAIAWTLKSSHFMHQPHHSAPCLKKPTQQITMKRAQHKPMRATPTIYTLHTTNPVRTC